MDKRGMLRFLSKRVNCTQRDAANFLIAFKALIETGLKESGKVAIPKFGSFQLVKRNARQGRNPRTLEVIDIPACTIVKFKPSPRFSEQVFGKEPETK